MNGFFKKTHCPSVNEAYTFLHNEVLLMCVVDLSQFSVDTCVCEISLYVKIEQSDFVVCLFGKENIDVANRHYVHCNGHIHNHDLQSAEKFRLKRIVDGMCVYDDDNV